MSSQKKNIRLHFRKSSLERDLYKCRKCGVKGKDSQGGDEWMKVHKGIKDAVPLDVHHITDRSEMPNGGYVKENGISLCNECHVKAEEFHITDGQKVSEGFHPDDLYKLINSSRKKAVEASQRLNE